MGKWAFLQDFFSNWRKSAIFGQKTPKKCHFQKMHLAFSDHFCFPKPGFCPLFLGFFKEKLSVRTQKISKTGLLPKFTKQNRAKNLHIFRVCTDLFLSSPNPSVPFINQNNATFNLKTSQITQVKQRM